MSFVFAGVSNKYLQATISHATSPTTPFSALVWAKINAVGYQRFFEVVQVSIASPSMRLGTGGDAVIAAGLSNTSQMEWLLTDDALSTTAWVPTVLRYNPAIGVGGTGTLNVGAGGEHSDADWLVWPAGNTLDVLRIGEWLNDPGHFYAGKMGHIALWFGHYLSNTDRDALLASGNPLSAAVAPTYYWPARNSGDGFTAFGGSLTLSQTGTGTDVAFDGDDNPSVDDPPEEGGGITLTQIERGRVLARGLTRGLA